LQEDRFFGAYFLAITAEDAAEHVDFEFERHLLGVRAVGLEAAVAGRNDPDGLGRTDEFAKLARDALGVAILIFHEIRGAAIAFGHDPFRFRIEAARDFLGHSLAFEKSVLEMPPGDLESANDGRQIKAFPETECFARDDHFFSSVTASQPRTMIPPEL